jgi:hypothetical protein
MNRLHTLAVPFYPRGSSKVKVAVNLDLCQGEGGNLADLQRSAGLTTVIAGCGSDRQDIRNHTSGRVPSVTLLEGRFLQRGDELLSKNDGPKWIIDTSTSDNRPSTSANP